MKKINEFLIHLEAEKDISRSTREAYASDLKKFFEYLNNNNRQQRNMNHLTAKSFSQFLDHQKKLGLKPSTLHRRRVTLKKYAEFLNSQGELDNASVEEIAGWQQGLWEEIANREAFALSDVQITQLFEAIDDSKPRNIRDKMIISMILETGLSIGALVDLNLSDVNLRAKQIRDSEHQDFTYSIESSVSYVKDYLAKARPELTQSLNEEALIVSQMGGRITRQGVWQVIRAWGEAAGVKEPLSPRVLRHTAVRRMLNAGKPVEQIQQLLGHGNKLSTQALIRKITKTQKPRRKKRK